MLPSGSAESTCQIRDEDGAITGTYRALRKKHIVRYLAEFKWRFNHCFDLLAMIPALDRAAVATKPQPYWWLLAEPDAYILSAFILTLELVELRDGRSCPLVVLRSFRSSPTISNAPPFEAPMKTMPKFHVNAQLS